MVDMIMIGPKIAQDTQEEFQESPDKVQRESFLQASSPCLQENCLVTSSLRRRALQGPWRTML